MKSYQRQFVVIEQMHMDTYVCAHMHTENTHKTAQLAHKYFCEQDVGNDKHSSWLLNRSALQCVVHSMCTRFTVPCMCVCVGGESRWEFKVINIETPQCLLVECVCDFVAFSFFLCLCVFSLPSII